MNDVNDAYLAIGEGTTEKKQKISVEEIKKEICTLEKLIFAFGMLN